MPREGSGRPGAADQQLSQVVRFGPEEGLIDDRGRPPRLAALTALASTVAACGGRSDSAAGDVPCEGSAGGHLSLTERADMVYTVSFREDGDGGDVATIEAVIVARGAAGWKTSERSRTRCFGSSRRSGGM